MVTSAILIEQVCRDCGQTKHIEEFIKHRGKKSGYDNLCRVCNRNRVKTWRKVARKRIPQYDGITGGRLWRKIIMDTLIQRDGFSCGICGNSLEESKIHFDHIIPRAFGGKDTIDNIRLTHAECNIKDSHRIRKMKHGY